MDDRRRKLMEVVHAQRDFEREALAVVPGKRDVLVLEDASERLVGAELKDDGEVGELCAGSEEHDDVGVPERLHGTAFV